jgi:hypothetical protein
VSKAFDTARTPYQRVLVSPEVGDQPKEALRETYPGLNPAQLKPDIVRCQDRLMEITKGSLRRERRWGAPDDPLRKPVSWRQASRTC